MDEELLRALEREILEAGARERAPSHTRLRVLAALGLMAMVAPKMALLLENWHLEQEKLSEPQ